MTVMLKKQIEQYICRNSQGRLCIYYLKELGECYHPEKCQYKRLQGNK